MTMTVKKNNKHLKRSHFVPIAPKPKHDANNDTNNTPKIKIDTQLSLRTHHHTLPNTLFYTIPSVSAIERDWKTPMLIPTEWKQFKAQIAPLDIAESNQKEVDCFEFKSPLFPSLFNFFKDGNETPIIMEDKVPPDISTLYDAHCLSLQNNQ